MQSPLDGSILGRTLWGHHWTLPFQPLWWASFFPYEEDAEMNLCLHWAGPEKIHQLIAQTPVKDQPYYSQQFFPQPQKNLSGKGCKLAK